jgi:hypothetical protein
MAAGHAEGGLELILLADTELLLCTFKVQLRAQAGSQGLVDKLLHVGQGATELCVMELRRL